MTDKLDDRELQKIIKELKQRIPDIKVGVLGKYAARDESINNAELAAIHEFGTDTIPERSFLRMPIFTRLPKVLEGIEKQKKLNVREMSEKIGASAVAMVIAAFASSGFGEWPRSKKGINGMANDTLIDTGQLRDSISYEVD